MNSIGEKCPKCGIDNWHIKDENRLYKKICMNCYEVICIDKLEYVKKFECPECGCLSGTIEENDLKLGVRCNNCKKLFIKLNKVGVCESTRTGAGVNIPLVQSKNSVKPKCPTCGSTNIEKISVGKKLAGSMLFGLFSKDAKSTFHCKNCNYNW